MAREQNNNYEKLHRELYGLVQDMLFCGSNSPRDYERALRKVEKFMSDHPICSVEREVNEDGDNGNS